MTALSEMGAMIAPPVPAFYAKPDSLDEMVDHTVGRALDLFDIDVGIVSRWGERPNCAAVPSPRNEVSRMEFSNMNATPKTGGT